MDGATQLDGLVGSAGERLLQAAYGSEARARRFYDTQMLDHLNEAMREFVARQEMMFVATADAHGHCDATFRAGPPGFVAVLSGQQIAWPEYRGNGVTASLGNLTENANAGLLFVDFFRDVIGLHVNGHAGVVDDGILRVEHPHLPVDPTVGRRAERWVVVDVEEAYVHCRKHIPRLAKVPRQRDWGTDDARRKGGDFFGAAAEHAATARDVATGDLGDPVPAASAPADPPALAENPVPPGPGAPPQEGRSWWWRGFARRGGR